MIDFKKLTIEEIEERAKLAERIINEHNGLKDMVSSFKSAPISDIQQRILNLENKIIEISNLKTKPIKKVIEKRTNNVQLKKSMLDTLSNEQLTSREIYDKFVKEGVVLLDEKEYGRIRYILSEMKKKDKTVEKVGNKFSPWRLKEVKIDYLQTSQPNQDHLDEATNL